MSIPKLDRAGNGFFYAVWSDQGRSKRKSMGTQDPRVAQDRFAQWLLMRNEIGAGTGRSFTVAEAWAVYAEHHIPTIAGPRTLAFNWQNLRPHFGDLPVEGADQTAVDGYVAKRTSGRLGRPVKPQTVRKELSALFAALKFSATPPHRLYDPSLVQTVTMPPAGEPRDRWLRMDEVQRLLDAAARLRRGPHLSKVERFLWLALETAARQQAILDLTWDRVDFEINVIHFDVPGRRTTKKRRVSVPISTALRPVLERAWRERTNNLVVGTPSKCWASVQMVALEAGFKGERPKPGQKPRATGISPHVFRHTAATHMARRGVPLWSIAKILGNTLKMVERVYAKWCPQDAAGTVDMISGGRLEAAA